MAINFYRGGKQSFTSIESKDANGIYVLNNGELYLGDRRIAFGVSKVDSLPAVNDAAEGILYILPTGEGQLFDGTKFNTVMYKTVATVEDDTEVTAIPNVAALKEYVATHGGSGTSGVQSVTAADNSITIAGETNTPTVAVKISVDEDNALSLKENGLYVAQGAAPEYSIVKSNTASDGYAASYELHKDGEIAGVKIDIPKDFLVKDASIKTAGDSDPSGLPNGTGYIDFVVNVDGVEEEKHIYIALNQLVPVYTAGNGITISGEHEVAVKVVAGNGLSVDTDGIKLGIATTDTAGAMSNTDKTKLDNLLTIKAVDGTTITEADGTIKTVKVPNALTAGGKTFDGSATVEITASDLNVYTKEEVTQQISQSLEWKEI